MSKGTHFAGPILGSNRAGGGLYKDISLTHMNSAYSDWIVYHEDFNEDMASITIAEQLGCEETVVGTAASRSLISTKSTGYLLINADTVADEGLNLQFNKAVSEATMTNSLFNTIGPIVSTATLMDDRGLAMEVRINLLMAAGAAWSSKFVVGWAVTDTACMTPSTGAVALATGGGMIFHAGEDGNLMFGVQSTSTYAEVDTGYDIPFGATFLAANWLTLGFRAVYNDASAATGYVDYYVNKRKIGRIGDTLPMTSTQTYAPTIELINGPATADQVDMAVDYIMTAITRPGVVITS